MSQTTLLVLAAGMGSRYGGLKQVDPVGPAGEILLEYSVYDALRAGIGRVCFIIRRDIEDAFHESIGKRLEGKVPFSYAYQELDAQLPAGFTRPASRTKPWGTGHAILCARDQIQGPAVAINADDFYGATAYRLAADHLATGTPDYAMVGFRLGNTLSEHGSVSRGLCQSGPDGYLESVVEHTKIERRGRGAVSLPEGRELTGDETVSMNFWAFQPDLFPELERQFREFLEAQGQQEKSEFYIPFVMDRIIQEGRGKVRQLTSPDPWFGVTYPEDKPRVVQEIAALDYPSPLWK